MFATDFRASTMASYQGKSADAVQKSIKSSADDAKVEKSAKDFEAILLGNWLQQAQESFAKVPGSDEDEDQAGAQFTQMAMQTLGSSFAGNGGIGIAKMIAANLHKTVAAEAKGNVTPNQVDHSPK